VANCSENGIALIKRFEGCYLRRYKCPAGVWTIGYGHTKGVVESTPDISQEYADELLNADIAQYERSVSRLISWPVNQNQFDALVSFTFNLGTGALQRSTLRQNINRGDIDDAANQFLKWVRVNGVISKGLLNRRKAERELFHR